VRLMRAPWEELEPASRHSVEKQHQALRRVEQLGDGVFAVAMTLLVLQLVVPQFIRQPSEAALRHALLDMSPAFYAYALSFLVLLMFWVLHHFEFHYMTRSSGGLIWLSAVLLVFVALAPFSTALVSRYAMTKTAVLFYEGNLLAIQLLLALTWRHAVGGGLLFGGDTPASVVRRMRMALLVGNAYLLLTIALVFIEPHLSMNVLIGLGVYYVVLTAKGGYTLELRKARPPTPGL
jgi:uncharacterized membrane protein